MDSLHDTLRESAIMFTAWAVLCTTTGCVFLWLAALNVKAAIDVFAKIR